MGGCARVMRACLEQSPGTKSRPLGRYLLFSQLVPKNYQTDRTTALSNGIVCKLARSRGRELLMHPPWRFGRCPRWDSSRPARSWGAVFCRLGGCSFRFPKFSGTDCIAGTSPRDAVCSGCAGKDVARGVVPSLVARGWALTNQGLIFSLVHARRGRVRIHPCGLPG